MSARRRDGSGETFVFAFPQAILDTENLEDVKEQLFALAEERPARLLLNFRKVEYVSTVALGVLITLHKKMEAQGGRLVLCFVDPEIYELFKLTKLDRLFRIEDDPAADQGVESSPQPRTVEERSRKKTGPEEPVIQPIPPKGQK